MPSYPAKPYEVPHDDWFSNNSSSLKNKSTIKGTKKISTIHEYFYKKSDLNIGGSDNHIQTNLEKKSSTKISISSNQNLYENFISISKEKNIYSKMPTEMKYLTKTSFKGNSFYKELSNKNIINFRSFLLDLKSIFFKIIRKNNKQNNL